MNTTGIHTKTIGSRTEAHVLARLMDYFELVLLPFGENQRFDLMFEHDAKFYRVQCKTGRLVKGAVTFDTCSVTYHHRANQNARNYRQNYIDQADYFGVYCRELDGVYLIPVGAVGNRAASLRVEQTKNSQAKSIRWARDYELPRVTARTRDKTLSRTLPAFLSERTAE